MKKLVLKNLKSEELSKSQLKNIFGGNSCSAYYCEFVNPDAACCGGSPDPDPDPDPDPGPTCGHYYCMFVAPWASCCL
jgi:natural product precursor